MFDVTTHGIPPSKSTQLIARYTINCTPDTTIVVLGDFNNDGKKLLPLEDSAAVTNYAPTHLTGKAYDHIFTSGKLNAVEIVRPPLPKHPNDTLKALWTGGFGRLVGYGPNSN